MGNNSTPGNRHGQSWKATRHTKNVAPHECGNCRPNSPRFGRLGKCRPEASR